MSHYLLCTYLMCVCGATASQLFFYYIQHITLHQYLMNHPALIHYLLLRIVMMAFCFKILFAILKVLNGYTLPKQLKVGGNTGTLYYIRYVSPNPFEILAPKHRNTKCKCKSNGYILTIFRVSKQLKKLVCSNSNRLSIYFMQLCQKSYTRYYLYINFGTKKSTKWNSKKV